MPALRRAIRAFGYVNEERLRAGEAIIRSSRAPQPRPRPQLDGQLSWLEEVGGVNLQAPGVSVGLRRGGGFTDGDP